MTPDDWIKLVGEVSQVLRGLGYKFEWDWHEVKRITPDVNGTIVTVTLQGGFDTGTKKISISKLVEDPKRECKNVNVTISDDINVPVVLDNFKKLASFLFLHELGHKETGNGSELDANEFAREKLDDVVSMLN